MCGTANWYGGTIIDDIVPGHTGKGADFRLAEMKYGDYPGIYHMVDVDPRDWQYLPDVPHGVDSVNIDEATEEWLDKAGYIIGRLQRVIFYAEGVKETNSERDASRLGKRRRGATLGVFALLQGRPAVDQLARPDIRRHAPGHRRCTAFANRPRYRRSSPRRKRLPWCREDRRRGQHGMVGRTPTFGGGDGPDRQHGPQVGRLHLPRTQPHDRRHSRDW